MIGVILVVMQLPLVLIDLKRDERASRHASAVAEVTAAWGGSQRVTGPILVVPVESISEDGLRRIRSELRLTPAELNVDGTIEPRLLWRGIYQARVYTGRLKMTGSFAVENFDPENRVFLWNEARCVIGVSDSRGLRSMQSVKWQGLKRDLASGTGLGGWAAGLQAAVETDPDQPVDFEIDLVVEGSAGLEIVPVGTSTRVALSSTWPSPSFQGAFLPTVRSVGDEGFAAEWEVGELGRNLPKLWAGPGTTDAEMGQRMQETGFGVVLLPQIGHYRTIERAIKYGSLFFVAIFGGFFLFEVTGGRVLHGLNYVLVGAAVCLFYLALLALAEFWSFGAAYVTAALAASGLILLYAKAVLKDGKRLGVMSGILGGIFGYLFLVLRMEDQALVAGTLLLFVLLGAIMYATRNVGLELEENR